MQPFLSGRHHAQTPALKPVKGGGLSQASSASQGERVGGHQHAGNSPVLECVKEGDRVVRIVVTCGCGERIEIDCLYPAG